MSRTPVDGRDSLLRFWEQIDDAARWPRCATLVFLNQQVPSATLRDVYHVLVPGALLPSPGEPTLTDGWVRYHGTDRGDGLWTDSESGNYGLGFTIDHHVMLVADLGWVRTSDRDDDNCAPPADAEFTVGAVDDAALEQVVAVLVAWHAARGVTTFSRRA